VLGQVVEPQHSCVTAAVFGRLGKCLGAHEQDLILLP
jgi:hypothetical protein